jgi:hypothetical protein
MGRRMLLAGNWLEDTVLTAHIRSKLALKTRQARGQYLKHARRGNVAAAELHLDIGTNILQVATSQPDPVKPPRTFAEGPDPATGLGGHYDPIDHRGFPRNVDSEYKILTVMTDELLAHKLYEPTGFLHLFTERIACPSCYHVLSQFLERFPGICVRFYSDLPGRWLGLRRTGSPE